jgi:transposase-like protein
MYFQGISTRRVREVLETMCGFGLSAGEVSHAAAEIDEKLSAFRARSLAGQEYVYLTMDARYEKVRVNGQIVSQAVLVTAGITSQGEREILDWRVCDSESAESYKEVFRSLKDRGVRGVKLIISDAHEGMRAAMARHMQGVAWQRCRVHFIRELCRKASSKHFRELVADIRAVFKPEERAECMRRAEEMAVKWEAAAPRIARMLREGLESCLTVCALPSEHRRKLHSTNMLERLMRELKRRSRVVGIFPNAASCERLIGARLVELHDGWQTATKPYLAMDALQRPEYQGVLERLGGNAAQ